MDLTGKIAIITGGASGLGAGTAREFTKAGAKCALFDMNLAQAETTAKEIGGIAVQVNVADPQSVEKGIAEVKAKLGAPRVLVNCAGIGNAGKTFGKDGPLALEKFTQVITVNLIGTFNCIRLVAAEMSAQAPTAEGERGVIVNTASVAAFEGQVGQAAYSASKAGIHGMTLPIARDFMEIGIRVCTIAPGLFSTPMLHGLPDNVKSALAASVPFPKRFGEPSEYGRLARHIVENGMLNGETIRLDGAIRMAPR